MTNEEFIRIHKNDDVRQLALRKAPADVQLSWCLTQIEGWQLAQRKLPLWASRDGIIYPLRLSMEQCSSEDTAQYKAEVVRSLTEDLALPTSLCDITGGFGVDFSYMARMVTSATYIEQQEVLCNAARHNMPLLQLDHATIINADATSYIMQNMPDSTTVMFCDPARRDAHGRKTVAFEDCTPDIVSLQDTLLSKCRFLIIKSSPMLDISIALRSLKNVIEVHVVSVKGECKELLFVLANDSFISANNLSENDIRFFCANLGTQEQRICGNRHHQFTPAYAIPVPGMTILEPNSAILKAGLQEVFAERYSLRKLHPMSNLYLSDAQDYDITIPARQFHIKEVFDFSKQSLKLLTSKYPKANITIRNFPGTVAELRKRLKIKEGGTAYLFVTTLSDNSHAIIVSER